MSRFLPGTDLSKYEPDSLTGGRPRLKEDRTVYAGGGSPIRGVSGHDYLNDPKYKDHRDKQPRREIVNKPTRDLNDDRVWSGGSRDFDERSGTYRPKEGGRGLPKPKRDWWQEPRRDYRPEKSAKERRLELLTGGGGGSSRDSDRYSLLTGRGLSSNEDRMAMLTGRSDPPKEEWKSQYGGRREYDPQDREFNRQFNTEPTANRDVLSQFRTEGSTGGYPVPTFKDQVDHMKSGYDKGGDIQREIGEWTGIKGDAPRNVGEDPTSSKPKQYWEGGRKYETIPATFNDNYYGEGKRGMVAPEMRTEITPQAKYDDSSIKERLRALENRSPIVNQPTVDLSGVEGRISQLEGKGSDWQEDRIAALEGRKPQDLSGIQGRLSELESKGPSWQEDRVKQLEGSRSESKSARNLLDQRIATLENYYKNDPPPADSTGNRYEDKLANLNKMWEQQGSTWDQVKDTQRYQGTDDDRKWTQWGQDTWTSNLPDPYVNQVRDLNKEYNKPTSTAIIKGREYKSYGPRADKRLSYLDKHNIHEDEYLGTGTWKNQYGQDVSGWNRGYQDRYFASHSGLDKESDEYKMRFRGLYPGWEEGQSWGSKTSDEVLKNIKERGYGIGKDYAYYG